jgi:hypothetical protein
MFPHLRFIFLITAMICGPKSWSSDYLCCDVSRNKSCMTSGEDNATQPFWLCIGASKTSNESQTSNSFFTDTTKMFNSKVLFGRSRLKTHFELHGKTKEVNIKKRDIWINETINHLKSMCTTANFEVISKQELIHEDFYQMSFRLIENGKIIFQDGSYLHLVSTSAHTTKDIGDVTLAINKDGDVYINQGHICGGIIHFKTHKKDMSNTAVSFLENFKSDTDDEPWILHKVSNKHKTNKQKF